MSTRRFLDQLFAGCTGGVVELRSFPSGTRAWAPLGAWRTLGPFLTAAVRAKDNVAVGVATRKDDSSGTASNLLELPAMFVDVDHPPAQARARLARLPVRPSLLVSSGRGVHSYYRLREPVDLTNMAERVQAIAVQRRLAHYLGADTHATDLTRVLRVPGAWSFKYGTPHKVEVLEQTDAAVNLAELDELLPGERVEDGELVPADQLRKGTRNGTLHALARSLRWRRLPSHVLVRVMETANATWCSPPLPAVELFALLRSALTAADDPTFLARHTDDIEHDSAPARTDACTCAAHVHVLSSSLLCSTRTCTCTAHVRVHGPEPDHDPDTCTYVHRVRTVRGPP